MTVSNENNMVMKYPEPQTVSATVFTYQGVSGGTMPFSCLCTEEKKKQILCTNTILANTLEKHHYQLRLFCQL